MAKNTRQINVWEINWSMDLKTAHKSEFVLDATNDADTNVFGAFCSDGTIFVAQSDGIWHVSQFYKILNGIEIKKNHITSLFFALF